MNIWQKSGILIAATALIGGALLAGVAYAQTPTPEAEDRAEATVEAAPAAEATPASPGAGWFGGRMFQGREDGPMGWMSRFGGRMMHRGEQMGGPGMMRGGMRGAGMMGQPFDMRSLMGQDEHLAIAAEVLDMDVAALRAALQEGKTLIEIAEAQGMDEAELRAAFQTELGARLDQAVQDGKLTAAQAATLKEQMTNYLPLLGERYQGLGRGMMGQRLGANVLGDPRELIAEATGMTVEELDTALKATVEKRLAAAVEKGELTQAQADSIKAHMEAGGSLFGGPGRGWWGK